ncbi:MAG: glycerophosphodiester phosphodiesterase family protein [Muribaculaceae bacterium]|nr:glycerophosphodiester phosphodiesterase family protein [Muribaculaceae bacterium]
MNNKDRLIGLLLLFLVQPLHMAAQRAEAIRNDVLNPKLDKVLVVAHRGNWSIAPENSVAAIDSAINMKVDIVELDVHKTKDGQLVLMHDSSVDRTTNGTGKVNEMTLAEIKQLRLKDKDGAITDHTVPTLEEALIAAKGNIMVNLDKAYDFFDEVYAILERTGTADLVIMKGGKPVEAVKREFGRYLDKVIYMPVVTVDEESSITIVSDFVKQLNPVAFELCYRNASSPVPDKLGRMLAGNNLIWYNTLWESLCGGHDDAAAKKDPDAHYGYLIDTLGARILQTDSPAYMLDYLRSKGLHD